MCSWNDKIQEHLHFFISNLVPMKLNISIFKQFMNSNTKHAQCICFCHMISFIVTLGLELIIFLWYYDFAMLIKTHYITVFSTSFDVVRDLSTKQNEIILLCTCIYNYVHNLLCYSDDQFFVMSEILYIALDFGPIECSKTNINDRKDNT